MTKDWREEATFKAVLILIDSLPAGARALLRNKMVEDGVRLPPRGKPGRKPTR